MSEHKYQEMTQHHLNQHILYVLVVDFEAYRVDDRSWMAFAAAICAYPKGFIMESITRILKIPIEQYDEPRKQFWTGQAKESHEYLIAHGSDPSCAEQYELELVKFVRDAHRKYPTLQIISDNPSFDICLLDNILLKHKQPASCYRANGTWTHTICTYSFQVALQDAYHTKNLHMVHRRFYGYNRLVLRQVDNISADESIAHTPYHDIMRVASNYFIALDLSRRSRFLT